MLFKSLGWPSFIFWFLRHQSRHFVSFRPWTRDVAICVKSSKLGTWYSERVILQFMCVGSLAGVTYLRYTVLTRSNKSKTAVYCCEPALSVLVMLVSRNVFHVVSALQSIVTVLNTVFQIFSVVTKNRCHLRHHTFQKSQKYLYSGKYKEKFTPVKMF